MYCRRCRHRTPNRLATFIFKPKNPFCVANTTHTYTESKQANKQQYNHKSWPQLSLSCIVDVFIKVRTQVFQSENVMMSFRRSETSRKKKNTENKARGIYKSLTLKPTSLIHSQPHTYHTYLSTTYSLPTLRPQLYALFGKS